MNNAEESDMAASREFVRKRNSTSTSNGPHRDGDEHDDDDRQTLLPASDSMDGSLSKLPKQSSVNIASCSSSSRIACIALAVLVGGLVLLLGSGPQEGEFFFHCRWVGRDYYFLLLGW